MKRHTGRFLVIRRSISESSGFRHDEYFLAGPQHGTVFSFFLYSLLIILVAHTEPLLVWVRLLYLSRRAMLIDAQVLWGKGEQ